MNKTPTSEERIWAVLSHLSALAFGMGILLPILGWSEQRRKSNYASFQCLQSLGYQSLGYTVWLLSYLLGMILFLVLMLIVMSSADENTPWAGTVSLLWAGFIIFFALGLFALYLLFPIIGAIACALGKDFRYPIMGKRLEKYLDYQPAAANDKSAPLTEEHEERWVASMGHFSVIILLWGLIAPVTTWIVQGKQSAFLKFQSIQTAVYQGIVNILYLGAVVVYFIGIAGLLAMLGLGGNQNMNSPVGMLGIIIFFFSLFIAGVLVLVVPLFHILGQWAGFRVLKGDNYRYPIIGKLVEKRLAKT